MNKKPTLSEDLLKHATFVRKLAICLTGDRQKAEDIEQDVWLAAVRRPPAEKKSIRAWLRVVVRNLVAKQGMDEARRPSALSPATLDNLPHTGAGTEAERGLLKSVVAHVLDLPEPYQTTLMLRFYQGMSVREVGEKTGVTHATARHRIDRALQLLESSLHEQHRDTLPDWRGSLALVCGLSTLVKPANSALGAGLIMAKVKTVSASLIVIVVCVAGYFGWEAFSDVEESSLESDPSQVEIDTSTRARREGGSKPAVLPSQTEVSDTAVREESKPEIVAENIVLELVWQVDGAPAPNIKITVREAGPLGAGNTAKHLVTDQSGRIDLGPMGKKALLVRTPRFPNKLLKRIETGTSGLVRVEIPLGVGVRGRVVDKTGSAVVGADILIAGNNTFASTSKVAVSGADGSFFLKQISPRSYVAARHRDFAPSNLFAPPASVGGKPEIPLTLVLESNWCRLTGRVTGPDGAPLSGALIKAGQNRWQRHVDVTGTARFWSPANVVRTNEEGVFDTGRLASGIVDIVVATADQNKSLHVQSMQMNEGETRHLEIQLVPSPIVAGVVRDEDGRPLSGVSVLPDFHDYDVHRLIPWGGFSDKDGRFEVRGLAAGHMRFSARLRSGAQKFVELELKAGKTVEWNPVFASGARIRGRLVDERGEPLPNWTVNARNNDPRKRTWRVMTETGFDGRFDFSQCPDSQDIELTFSHFEQTSGLPALVKIVKPSDDEIFVRITAAERPTSKIIGQVVDAKGNRPPAVQLWVGLDGSDTMNGFSKVDENGYFEIGPVSAGRYRIKVDATGFGAIEIDPFDLKAESTKDLGKIRFQSPARLVMEFAYPNGKPAGLAFVNVIKSKGKSNAEQVIIEGQEEASFPLLPGQYRIEVRGEATAVVESTQEISLHSGNTTRVHVTIAVPD